MKANPQKCFQGWSLAESDVRILHHPTKKQRVLRDFNQFGNEQGSRLTQSSAGYLRYQLKSKVDLVDSERQRIPWFDVPLCGSKKV